MKKIFICASVVTGTVILSFTANAQKMNTAASPKAPEATANKLLPVQ